MDEFSYAEHQTSGTPDGGWWRRLVALTQLHAHTHTYTPKNPPKRFRKFVGATLNAGASKMGEERGDGDEHFYCFRHYFVYF